MSDATLFAVDFVPTEDVDGLNSARLSDFMGGDLAHARAAWASTKFEDIAGRIDRIPDLLINKLARQVPPHTSPFEHSSLTFRITCDQPTCVHFIKHRTFKINSQSARYSQFKDDRALIPNDWSKEEQARFAAEVADAFDAYHARLARLETHYRTVLGMSTADARRRAKESARFGLPLAHQYTIIVTTDFLNFVHFLQLRLHPMAQKEIRAIARSMLAQVEALEGSPFLHSLAAYGYHPEDYAFPANTTGMVPNLLTTRPHDPMDALE